ncbi:MAG: hypothetical protein AB4426_06095 [Xenococcaceae cyanobacterium]
MKNKQILSAIIFGTISSFTLCAAPTYAVNLVSNGDFSEYVPINSTGGGWSNTNIAEDLSNPAGWTSSGGSFDEHFILNASGEIAFDPTLEQIINGFVIGNTYTVYGEFESIYPCCGDPLAESFGVEIASVQLQEFTRPSDLGSFSFDFVATNTTHTLRITAERNGDDSSYRVDNIAIESVSFTSVPEPLSILSLGMVFLGFGISFKRQGKPHASLKK